MHIVVVGGGASGVAVVLMLLRHTRAGDRITHIDPSSSVGTGVAYRTPDDTLLLNVRAYNMSIYADMPTHFADWVGQHHGQHDTHAFVARRWYAHYLQATLLDAVRASVGIYTHIQAHVSDIHPESRTLVLDNGQHVTADHIVLALGHAPSANPLAHWVPNPTRVVPGYDWQRIAHDITTTEPVIMIGTGLTMVDALSTLWHAGHTAPIIAVSRHGHLPQSHITYTPHPGFLDPSHYGAPLQHIMRLVRHEVAQAQQHGQPWQAVIDAIRPHTQAIWMGWSLADKQRFLRHVRAHWDIYRHRIAPHLATQLTQAQARGQLTIHAGRIRAYHETAHQAHVHITPRGSNSLLPLTAAWVINCTGPESDYTRISNPLVVALTRRGLLQADDIRLGIAVDAQGHLKDHTHQIIPWLWTIGPPRKGFAWECIAIPDIRVQAAQLAQAIIAG